MHSCANSIKVRSVLSFEQAFSMSNVADLFSPFVFPCGKEASNRLVKSAMEENMANSQQLPGSRLLNLYRHWADGQLGTIVTGNVMVDKLAMTGPGSVVLEANTALEPFKQWAKVIKSQGALAVMQINHPGRQALKKLGGKVLAPSAIQVDVGRFSRLFDMPVEMSQQDIDDVTARFVTTAIKAKEAGFDGVQIHSAHGYLLSQFLSPLTNQRNDQWGGSLTNRSRLLVNIVSQIRANCGSHFLVMVKLNSADFQRGGFDIGEAVEVVKLLQGLNVDGVELSGGNYEAPAMQGNGADERRLAREAYFLEFASHIKEHTCIPVMTTGGIMRRKIAEQVLEKGCDLVGMASALAITPDLVNKWLSKPDFKGVIPHCTWSHKALSALANMAAVRRQLRRLGDNHRTQRHASFAWSLILDEINKRRLTRRYQRWIKQNS